MWVFVRDNLETTLGIVDSIIEGCLSMLPIWKEEPLQLKKSVVKSTPMILNLGLVGEIRMPDGGNVRSYVVDLLRRLQKTMFEHAEDDTKSFYHLLQVTILSTQFFRFKVFSALT